jgi:hypothetical protein
LLRVLVLIRQIPQIPFKLTIFADKSENRHPDWLDRRLCKKATMHDGWFSAFREDFAPTR